MLWLIQKINEHNKEKQQPPLSSVFHDLTRHSRGGYIQRPIVTFPFVESNCLINTIYFFLTSTIIVTGSQSLYQICCQNFAPLNDLQCRP